MVKIEIINGKVDLTDSEYRDLDNMLYWIAKRYDGWSGLDYEDLKQELWIKCINTIKAKFGTIPYNELKSLIAMNCYNLSKDILRKRKKEYNKLSLFSYDFGNTEDEDLDNSQQLSQSIINGSSKDLSKNNDIHASLFIEDLLQLFIDDEKATDYLLFVGLYFDIELDRNQDLGRLRSDFFQDSSYENEIARALGFANSMSSGYRKVRNRVRKKLDVYGYKDILNDRNED